jgi:hypothetical protein
MDWIFLAFLGAAVLHVFEEYFYPGGFPGFMKRGSPPLAPFITKSFAILINGLFLVLCTLGAIFRSDALVFSLSIGSLLLFNGLTHLAGSLRTRSYAPGMVSGLLLYIPLGITAYILFFAFRPDIGFAGARFKFAGDYLPGHTYRVFRAGFADEKEVKKAINKKWAAQGRPL